MYYVYLHRTLSNATECLMQSKNIHCWAYVCQYPQISRAVRILQPLLGRRPL